MNKPPVSLNPFEKGRLWWAVKPEKSQLIGDAIERRVWKEPAKWGGIFLMTTKFLESETWVMT